MTINIGYIELFCAAGSGGGVTARIYYDNTQGIGAGGAIDTTRQSVINGPNGAALEVTNTTGGDAIIRLTGPTGTKLLGQDGTEDVKIPATGLTATANQLRQQVGIDTRADASNFSLSSP